MSKVLDEKRIYFYPGDEVYKLNEKGHLYRLFQVIVYQDEKGTWGEGNSLEEACLDAKERLKKVLNEDKKIKPTKPSNSLSYREKVMQTKCV